MFSIHLVLSSKRTQSLYLFIMIFLDFGTPIKLEKLSLKALVGNAISVLKKIFESIQYPSGGITSYNVLR